MNYDRDVITAIYLIQEQNPELAERIFERLTQTPKFMPQESSQTPGKHVYHGRVIPMSLVISIVNASKHNGFGGGINKVLAIKTLRDSLHWSLKDAKDTIDEWYANGYWDNV